VFVPFLKLPREEIKTVVKLVMRDRWCAGTLLHMEQVGSLGIELGRSHHWFRYGIKQ